MLRKYCTSFLLVSNNIKLKYKEQSLKRSELDKMQ